MLKKGLPFYYQVGFERGSLKRSETTDKTETLVAAGNTNHFGVNQSRIEQSDPAKNLMAAILLRAMYDLEITSNDQRTGETAPFIKFDAYHWIFGDPLPGERFHDLLSFRAVCDFLSLEISAARKAIKNLLPPDLDIPPLPIRYFIQGDGRKKYRSSI